MNKKKPMPCRHGRILAQKNPGQIKKSYFFPKFKKKNGQEIMLANYFFLPTIQFQIYLMINVKIVGRFLFSTPNQEKNCQLFWQDRLFFSRKMFYFFFLFEKKGTTKVRWANIRTSLPPTTPPPPGKTQTKST